MTTESIPQLTYSGNLVDMDQVGLLRRSDDAVGDRDELWRRMGEHGYLFLPGYLNRDEVVAARVELCDRLTKAGVLDPDHPALEGVIATGEKINAAATGPFMPLLAKDNAPLHKVLYDGSMMAFYKFFLGGEVRHYDYTWFRAKKPGTNTATTPHCDIVYMGRGTKELYTSWTPFGDVPYEMGGLMVLEDSHKNGELKGGYGQTDVDMFCENDSPEAREIVETARIEQRELTGEERGKIRWNSSGAYSNDAIAVREELRGRWLTSEYKMGDLLVFCMYLLHASSDNQTDRIRLSSDSRYQLAREAVDERWIGADPPAHGIRAKRGMVC